MISMHCTKDTHTDYKIHQTIPSGYAGSYYVIIKYFLYPIERQQCILHIVPILNNPVSH